MVTAGAPEALSVATFRKSAPPICVRVCVCARVRALVCVTIQNSANLITRERVLSLARARERKRERESEREREKWIEMEMWMYGERYRVAPVNVLRCKSLCLGHLHLVIVCVSPACRLVTR